MSSRSVCHILGPTALINPVLILCWHWHKIACFRRVCHDWMFCFMQSPASRWEERPCGLYRLAIQTAHVWDKCDGVCQWRKVSYVVLHSAAPQKAKHLFNLHLTSYRSYLNIISIINLFFSFYKGGFIVRPCMQWLRRSGYISMTPMESNFTVFANSMTSFECSSSLTTFYLLQRWV